MKTATLAASLIAVTGAAQAASLTLRSFEGDQTFVDSCRVGGDNQACEGGVAEGRAGDPNTTWELGLGDPNSSTTANLNSGGGTADFDWTGGPHAFSLAYDGSESDLVFELGGVTLTDFDISLNDFGAIFMRPAGRSATETAAVTDMQFTSGGMTTALGDLLGDDTRRYLAFNGFAPNADWTLAGNAALTGGSGSARSFPVKLTDVELPPIPLPAAGWLPIGGVSSLFGVTRARRAA